MTMTEEQEWIDALRHDISRESEQNIARIENLVSVQELIDNKVIDIQDHFELMIGWQNIITISPTEGEKILTRMLNSLTLNELVDIGVLDVGDLYIYLEQKDNHKDYE